MASSVYDFSAATLDGAQVSLAEYRGKVVLIVNTASQCGFTPQYAELESLWRSYREQGLVVLGFPCNQFNQQEPGANAEIGAFCETNFGVSFPLFAKVDVNGTTAHPLFHYLKAAAPGVLGSQSVKWNFTKFLVDRNGQVVARHAPMTRPLQLETAIQQLLESP